MEEDIRKRIKAFIRSKEPSVKQFEENHGFSNGAINNAKYKLPDMVEAVKSIYPDMDARYIMFGIDDADAAPSVPLVNMFALGGSLTEQLDSTSVDELESVQTPVKGAEMAIQVSGDSMAPKYPSGSRLFCRHVDDPTFIEWGKVYVIDTTQGAVVKELRPGSSSDNVMCYSLNDNKKYVPFEVPLSSIHGIWKVIAGLVIE